MNRYLLDTNVLSNVIKPTPSPSLVAWMAEQDDEDLFISAWTLAEIWCGVLSKPTGKKRRELEKWFSGPAGPPTLFGGRILPFDDRAGLIWGRLMSEGARTGRPRSPLDMIVAAIAEANNCLVVTDNDAHFTGVKTINPVRGRV